MLVFARTPSTIMKAEAGFLGSWYFQDQAWISSSCCASVAGERHQSATLNSGGLRMSLPKHRSCHCFSPTHTVPPKKKIHVQQWDQKMALIIPTFLRITHS